LIRTSIDIDKCIGGNLNQLDNSINKILIEDKIDDFFFKKNVLANKVDLEKWNNKILLDALKKSNEEVSSIKKNNEFIDSYTLIENKSE
jgi:N-acetylneuraminic acid mutarotase